MVQQASPQHRTIGKPRGCGIYSGLLPVPPVTTELVRAAYTLSDSSSYKNTKRNSMVSNFVTRSRKRGGKAIIIRQELRIARVVVNNMNQVAQQNK